MILIVGQSDVTVSFVTSQLDWAEDTDVQVQPSVENGLKTMSLIRLSKLATIDADLVLGKLGSLSLEEIQKVDSGLIRLLDLD